MQKPGAPQLTCAKFSEMMAANHTDEKLEDREADRENRVLVTPEGGYRLPGVNIAMVNVMVFAQWTLDEQDIDIAVPREIKKWARRSLDNVVAEQSLKNHARNCMNKFVNQSALPYAV